MAREEEKKGKGLLAREKSISWREETLEDEIENRAQDLFRDMRDKFFEKMREMVLNLKNTILNVLDKLILKVIFAEIKESISKVLNNSKSKL